MRRFHLSRHVDASGVSGTGTVAEGVVFSDGTAVLRWLSEKASTAIYSSIHDLEAVHGHEGATEIMYYAEDYHGSHN